MSNQTQPLNFKEGKEPRNQLELPTLHFIVTDQWTDVLSEKAIFSWLRMYSWCKRDEENAKVNLWEQSRIPYSFTKLRKKLNVGNDTFYNKILKPLWNVGLIDIEEYDTSDNKGTKPMNIIVYKYPQNNKALAYEPIKEIRNYDTDYTSNARTFAKKGGRPKVQGGSQIEHPPVPKQNTPPFSNRTPGGSQIEHINIFNTFSKSFNSLSNILNNINNLSIKEKNITNTGIPLSIQKQLIIHKDRLIDDSIQIEDIQLIYKANKYDINENQFAEILNTVLTHTKGSIGNIKNLLHIAINNYLTDVKKAKQENDKEQQETKNSEVIPEWFNKQKKQQKSKHEKKHSTISEKDWNETKKLLEEFSYKG